MATVETLIDSKIEVTDNLIALATEAVSSIDARKGAVGYSSLSINPNSINARYIKPAIDATPFPVYEAPAIALPDSPSLSPISGISSPVLPDKPEINTAGLFEQNLPTKNIPDWNEGNPVLHVDEIYNDLAALAAPILNEYDFPDIKPLSIRTAPTLTIPSFEAQQAPEAMPDVADYSGYLKAKYDNALPEMKAFIDDMVSGWIQRYAPEYEEQRSLLNEKLVIGMQSLGVLPDAFEDALYSRARDKSEKEYQANEDVLLKNEANRGMVLAPGAVFAGINRNRIARADNLSGQATDIYLERRRTEVQHLQFILGLAANQVNNIRSIAMQYAQTGLSLIGQSLDMAKSLTDKLALLFEHEKSKREFSLALMRELGNQYEIRLKSALSELEGFKLELQTAELEKNVELKVVDVIKTKIETESLKVARYSALIDAIAKRAITDELKLKELDSKSRVFDTQVKAILSSYEAYKAGIDGDKAKLTGELAKLDIFNAELKSQELNVGVQSKVIESQVETNRAKISQYSALLDAYKTSSQVALQKFTAGAEIKKLGMEIYKTNVDANLAVYDGELKADIAFINAQIDAFRGNNESLSYYYRLQQGYTELDLKKTEAIAQGYSNIASASTQSLGAILSKTSA
jgi:hypothetical protein